MAFSTLPWVQKLLIQKLPAFVIQWSQWSVAFHPTLQKALVVNLMSACEFTDPRLVSANYACRCGICGSGDIILNCSAGGRCDPYFAVLLMTVDCQASHLNSPTWCKENVENVFAMECGPWTLACRFKTASAIS